jgi:hypothetical protein
MNKDGSQRWVCFSFAVAMLMGSHAGCVAEDVSMGRDQLGARGGTAGADGGGEAQSGGSGSAPPEQDGAAARGGAEAASCDGFENTRFQDDVTVRYVNAGTQPIYVGRDVIDCGGKVPVFRLLDSSDQRLTLGEEDCVSCELLQAGPMRCPLDCPYAPLVRIDPGGSHDFSWSGTYWARPAMPSECYAPGNESWVSMHDSCPRLVRAEAASYGIVGTVWSDFVCDDSGVLCECTPSASGSCVWGRSGSVAPLVAGLSRQVTARLEYPRAKLVELQFD